MPINLIDPMSPPEDFKKLFVAEDKYTGWGDELIFFFKKENYIVICRRVETKKRITIDQIELPESAIRWISDSIENGFWGGQFGSKTHQATNVFDGEELVITRQQNAGVNIPGFAIRNKSRKDHDYADMTQVLQLCDPFLKNALIPEIKAYFGW